MLRSLLLLVGVCFAASAAMAQDPVKVDPQHYKVIFENDQVRVLRIHYGPHEKSVMHVHPNAVVVYKSDAHMKMTTPDGKSVVSDGKAGDSQWTPAGAHLPENAGDKPVDAVLVELKTK
jgi:oxalate decarboxylase/phosphoglucose isomerase-like protein (cupin superfamily)